MHASLPIVLSISAMCVTADYVMIAGRNNPNIRRPDQAFEVTPMKKLKRLLLKLFEMHSCPLKILPNAEDCVTKMKC